MGRKQNVRYGWKTDTTRSWASDHPSGTGGRPLADFKYMLTTTRARGRNGMRILTLVFVGLSGLFWAAQGAAQSAPENPARRAAAVKDFRRSCAQQISAEGSFQSPAGPDQTFLNLRSADTVGGRYLSEAYQVEASLDWQRNNMTQPDSRLVLCQVEVALRHARYGVPGYDSGAGTASPAAPISRPTVVAKARPERKLDPRLLAKREADEKLDHPWYEREKEVCAPETAHLLMIQNSWPETGIVRTPEEHKAAEDSYYNCVHAFEDKCPVPSYGHKVIPPGCPGAVGTSVASEPRTKSKCPAANEACPPPKGTQLRHTVKLGNPCIPTELLKNELNYNNLATVELTNDCKVAQVIHTQSYLESAPYQLFHFTYPFGPKYYGWFGKYPPEFPFQPVEPVPVFTMYPGEKTRLNFDGGHTIVVETAACDYVGAKKVMNRIYTDFGLRGFTQMACRPNPEPPPKPFSLTR